VNVELFRHLAIVMIFIGTIFTAHIGNGFFMNWYGTQKEEGFKNMPLTISYLNDKSLNKTL